MSRTYARWLACMLAALWIAFAFAPTPIAAASATAQEAIGHEALFEGDRGEAVKQMQRALVALGYLSQVPDGVYGPVTQEAVAAFQADYAPDEAAYATPWTLEMLYEAASPEETELVFIAPYSGKRYHAQDSCWGLQSAREIEQVTLSEALAQGKTPCKVCY